MPSKDVVFRTLIKDTREYQSMSLSEAAELIGCTKSHLWDLERGVAANPTIKTLAGIACAYDLDLGDVATAAATSCPGTDYRSAVGDLVRAKRNLKIVAATD
jgi:transcriptional regulator with XRE-family HTH domain